MRKIEDMDDVLITPEAYAAWQEMAQRVAQTLGSLGVRPGEIQDEEIWLKDDEKTLLIVCEMGRLKVSMDIPEGQWSWNPRQN